MKKVLFIAVALVAFILISCNKKQYEAPVIEKHYVNAIAGQFIPQDGDISLKKSLGIPTVGGHQINCYDIKFGQSAWSVIDGTEFFPGSASALDWANYVIDAATWWLPGQVYITYCPATLPMRVILKATSGAYGSPYSYIGIWEGTPNQASFPITVQDRRLGDVLTLNTDALTALPGYTNMSFDVVYTKNIIDVTQTEKTSPVTTTNWPVYAYSSTSSVTTILNATKNLGDREVYADLDAKITGTITINIHVDNTVRTVSTPAAGMGHGLKMTLKTNKVGFYDSGTIGVTENDITVETVDIPVE